MVTLTLKFTKTRTHEHYQDHQKITTIFFPYYHSATDNVTEFSNSIKTCDKHLLIRINASSNTSCAIDTILKHEIKATICGQTNIPCLICVLLTQKKADNQK